ncbi:MAG: molybdopterin-dependent oxidoreductase [Bacillota bacterium]
MMEISRRNFIKAGALGATALGLSGGLLAQDKWLRPVSAGKDAQENVAFTYHPPNCGGRCSFKCTTRDGKLAKIEPNEWPDKRYSLICLKGLAEVERVYSLDRIQTPLKRVGERGEGKFTPISWEEAITTVADNLKKAHDTYGGSSILFAYSTGIDHPFQILAQILCAQHVVEAGIDMGIGNGYDEATGSYNVGLISNESTDWVNSKTIILWGNNYLETSITDSQFFFNAKEAGAKIICIDPIYTTTAAKSDQWIPIKPGSDLALVLAMVSLVLENNWYQGEYLAKNTSAPFLIRSDNQKLLRLNNSDEEVDNNPFLVWDEVTNSLQPYNDKNVHPKLEGEFTVDGIKVKTVFTALKENQRQYTPAWAADLTEIPEQTIRILAEEYALRGPAILGFGWGGADKWGDSDLTGHAATILGALTGNIGRIGGGVGIDTGHFVSWPADLSPWPLPEEFQIAPREMTTGDFPSKPNNVKVMVNMGNTIQQHFANLGKTAKWVDTLDFVVTIDPFHSTSVDYSDIVLPASTSFEWEYDIGNMLISRNHVLLQQKILEPLHQSKSDFQIEKEIAEKMGLGHYMPKTPADYHRARLDSPDPALKGITVENLIANNCVMRLNVPDEPYRQFMDQVYATPSKKLELYYEKLIEDKQALPSYEKQQETDPSNSLTKKYPLQFCQQRVKYLAHSQFANSLWIGQLFPGPRLEINPTDAKNRNLKDGDIVEVFNDRGKFRSTCKLTEIIRPGQVRHFEGWWSKHMSEGNFQNVTNDTFNPRQYKLAYGPVIPFNDTLVEVKKA